MIGFLPLPINTEHKVDVFGLEVPSLALYAATANLSIPLVLDPDRLVLATTSRASGRRASSVPRELAAARASRT